MSLYLDTTGNSSLGIALCARCSRKFPIGELSPDPNYPGLMVCKDDRDDYDPYRLPAPPVEMINLPFVRPDIEITDGTGDFVPDFLEPPITYFILLQQGGALLMQTGAYLEIEPGA